MSQTPGVLGAPRDLRPLGPVSPSHYLTLKECGLREGWSSVRQPALLPSPPAARLGTVAHILLEEAGTGRLGDGQGDSVEQRWEELVAAAETAAAANWLDCHLVPFASSVPDYTVRRLRAIAAACAIAHETSTARGRRLSDQPNAAACESEVVVTTPDGRAAGRIDVVCTTADGIVIKDYKSGAIYGPDSRQQSIRPEYAVQLKLYAGIYAAMTGVWPARLEVVPVAGPAEQVPFTPEECQQLLEDAVERRDQVNDVIRTQPSAERVERLAKPSPFVCGNCPYRPQCRAYWIARESDGTASWPTDVAGRLADKRTLGNGKTLLALEHGGAVVQVRGLSSSAQRHPALELVALGDSVALLNLRSDVSPTSFREGPFTVIYRTEA